MDIAGYSWQLLTTSSSACGPPCYPCEKGNPQKTQNTQNRNPCLSVSSVEKYHSS